jgi:hypothetical protein
MSKKRLSRDQKRKARLTERRKKNPGPPPSLAYTGNKYKTDEYAPLFLSTETGILQADVISHHKLTDHHVSAALEAMVEAMRTGPLPDVDSAEGVSYEVGKETELISRLIRINWHRDFAHSLRPATGVLTGILRTLLNSINTFTTPSPTSRGYLSYITGFLRKAGVEVHRASSEGEIEEEEEDPFTEVGAAWVLDNDAHAKQEFLRQAEQMVVAGQGERVAEVAQYLLGHDLPSNVSKELMIISTQAQQGKRPLLPG